MIEILEAILTDPIFRTVVENIAVKIIADICHRRTVDPAFLDSSNKAFAALNSAKTDEELVDAQNAIRVLMSS